MDTKKVCLDPQKIWVEEVVRWLAAKVRKDATGAFSLTHLLLLVPTRQAGRRLRFQLAKTFGALLPPRILQPMQLSLACCAEGESSDGVTTRRATDMEETAVLLKMFVEQGSSAWPTVFPVRNAEKGFTASAALGMVQQLNEVWDSLAQNGLSLSDVAEHPGARALWEKDEVGCEETRWRELGELESVVFQRLHALGLHHWIKDLKAKRFTATVPELEGIEEIVLPGLVDPTPVLLTVLERLTLPITTLLHASPEDAEKFDNWGRPIVEAWTGTNAPILPLCEENIAICANEVEEAKTAAEKFTGETTLCMLDANASTSLKSAFLSCGRTIYTPGKHPLRVSSLGRIIRQLVVLLGPHADWKTFFAFFHNDDVLNWLCPETRVQALAEADCYQNQDIPLDLPSPKVIRAFRYRNRNNEECGIPAFTAAIEKLFHALAAAQGTFFERLTFLLREMYRSRWLFKKGMERGDREFATAVNAAMDVINSMNGVTLAKAGVTEEEAALLFFSALDSASFSQQPENDDVIETEGWLELMWSPNARIFVTGFNEGIVPESIVSHPFLPNSLRTVLGLQNNEQRLARDTYLLQELLLSRAPDAVRISFSQMNANGEISKPSRLLFLCEDTALPARARRLFRDPESPRATPPRALPVSWKLQLPFPERPPSHISPSALDAYLKCPFTYYLQRRLRMEAVDTDKQELGFADFGSLCHDILQRFAESIFRDSEDEEEILHAVLKLFEEEKKKRYGGKISTVFHMQLASVEGRLRNFARLQAAQRSAGWKILCAELPVPDLVIPEISPSIRVTGRIDRIDRDEQGRFCLIDYKTWNARKTGEKIFRTKKKQLEEMRTRGLPVFRDKKEKDFGWMSVQLPFYGMIMENLSEKTRIDLGLCESFYQKIVDFRYCLLGDTAGESGWYNGGTGQLEEMTQLQEGGPIFQFYDEARKTVTKLVRQLERGIFWPRSTDHENDPYWDFTSLFLSTPEEGISKEWIRDQEDRIAKERDL